MLNVSFELFAVKIFFSQREYCSRVRVWDSCFFFNICNGRNFFIAFSVFIFFFILEKDKKTVHSLYLGKIHTLFVLRERKKKKYVGERARFPSIKNILVNNQTMTIRIQMLCGANISLTPECCMARGCRHSTRNGIQSLSVRLLKNIKPITKFVWLLLARFFFVLFCIWYRHTYTHSTQFQEDWNSRNRCSHSELHCRLLLETLCPSYTYQME